MSTTRALYTILQVPMQSWKIVETKRFWKELCTKYKANAEAPAADISITRIEEK